GRGGDRLHVRSERAGDARVRRSIKGRNNVVTGGKVTGGDSIAQGTANGGDGGSPWISEDPLAQSGDSGTAWAQSTATNTGNTGPASSTANASPVAASGGSGDSGNTGKATADLTASNAKIKGSSKVAATVRSGDSGKTGATGDARAAGAGQSPCNPGALSPTHPASGSTRPAAHPR